MAMHTINLTVNGELEQVHVPSNLTLLGMLREKLALMVAMPASAAHVRY
jgi:aerobic-type carbon monoxide dehydrogenase small subunit (CoxS/CutS family)